MSNSSFQTYQNYRNGLCSRMSVMEHLTAKHATFSGNVTFDYMNENKNPQDEDNNDNEYKNITINDIISDIRFLKKENEKLKEIVDILWNAPPRGGPGYQEANENWKNRILKK